jgi:transcriptional regulator with XRE-family HTH domain
MKLCKKIAEARKHAGLTQSQLAAAIGVSLVSAQNYEYGKVARIGFDILQKIAVACRVPLDYFLDDQGTSRNIKEHFQPDQPTPTDIPARPTDTKQKQNR